MPSRSYAVVRLAVSRTWKPASCRQQLYQQVPMSVNSRSPRCSFRLENALRPTPPNGGGTLPTLTVRVLRYQCIKTPVPVLNAVPREVPYQVRLRAVNSAINTFRVLRAPKFWGCQLQGMGRQEIGAGVMFYHILPRPRAGIPYLPREFTSIA